MLRISEPSSVSQGTLNASVLMNVVTQRGTGVIEFQRFKRMETAVDHVVVSGNFGFREGDKFFPRRLLGWRGLNV